jgi:hypothetical protein
MAAKKKLLGDRLTVAKRAAPAAISKEDEAFIAGIAQSDKPRRGRPPSPVKKKPVMLYLPEELHESFRVLAQMSGPRPMSDILEELVQGLVTANSEQIEAARRALSPGRMAGKARFT